MLEWVNIDWPETPGEVEEIDDSPVSQYDSRLWEYTCFRLRQEASLEQDGTKDEESMQIAHKIRSSSSAKREMSSFLKRHKESTPVIQQSLPPLSSFVLPHSAGRRNFFHEDGGNVHSWNDSSELLGLQLHAHSIV